MEKKKSRAPARQVEPHSPNKSLVRLLGEVAQDLAERSLTDPGIRPLRTLLVVARDGLLNDLLPQKHVEQLTAHLFFQESR